MYIFHNLDEYGSISCDRTKECRHAQPKLLSKIKQLRYQVIHFDPNNFKQFPNNRVFASFDEREYLSHVQVLVTVGHGRFQQSIVERFLKNSRGNEKYLHRICYSKP